jgi:hypothetical protein
LLLKIEGNEVWVKLNFNAYNALAIYGTAVELGMDSLETLRLSELESVSVDSNTLFRVLILRRLLIMLIP